MHAVRRAAHDVAHDPHRFVGVAVDADLIPAARRSSTNQLLALGRVDGKARATAEKVNTIGAAYRSADQAARGLSSSSTSLVGSGKRPVGLASGGVTTTPLTWVGERGPEVMRAPVGSRVYPASMSRQMARSRGRERPSREVPTMLPRPREQLVANLTVHLDGEVLHRGVHRVERRLEERR